MPQTDFSQTLQAVLTQTALSSSFPMSILLIGLEALIDQEFSCPCSGYYWNGVATFLVFVTPPIFACALMFFYERFFKNNNNRNENMCARITNYCIPVGVWLFIILLDGQYLACSFAGWKGKYVSDGNLKRRWCQPSDQTANVTKLQEKNEKVVFWSQMSGYVLVLFLSLGLFIVSCCCRRNNQSHLQVPQELVVVFPNTISTEGHRNTIPVDIKLRNVSTAGHRNEVHERNEETELITRPENRNETAQNLTNFI